MNPLSITGTRTMSYDETESLEALSRLKRIGAAGVALARIIRRLLQGSTRAPQITVEA